MPEKRLTLDGLHDGGLAERFDRALSRVLENMMDPNTDYKKARKMTISISFTTTEDRKVLAFESDVTYKLVADKKLPGFAFLNEDKQGKLFATEAMPDRPHAEVKDPRQREMRATGPTVVPMRAKDDKEDDEVPS